MDAVACGVVDGNPVFVSGSDDNTVRVWDARTGQALGEPLAGHTDRVGAVACGVIDGDPVIVSGSNDNTVRVWDPRTGCARGQPLTGHLGGVAAVAFGVVDGDPVLASGGGDRTVRLWDVRSLSLSLVIPAFIMVRAIAVVPGGVVIAAGSSVLVVDVPGLQPQPSPF